LPALLFFSRPGVDRTVFFDREIALLYVG